MAKPKQKPSLKPSMNNPSGSVDKTQQSKNVPGISDDTRVIYSEEHNMNDG